MPKLSELTIAMSEVGVLGVAHSSRLIHIIDRRSDKDGHTYAVTRCNRAINSYNFQDVTRSAKRILEDEMARTICRLQPCPRCGSIDDFKAIYVAYVEILDRFYQKQEADRIERERLQRLREEEKMTRMVTLQEVMIRAGLETDVNGAGNLIITFGDYRYLIQETGRDYRTVFTATPCPNDIGS